MNTIAMILTALLLGTFGVAHADSSPPPPPQGNAQGSSWSH